MRGVESEPILLRFNLSSPNPGFRVSEPQQQQLAAQPTDLIAQEDQKIGQTSCSRCHIQRDGEAKGALILVVSQGIRGAKAGPSPQEYLEVDY
jgi:hypothetical protein